MLPLHCCQAHRITLNFKNDPLSIGGLIAVCETVCLVVAMLL